MSFQASGKFGKEKPLKPAEWPSDVYHHMIPWETLRAFWDKLVDCQHQAQMVQYLKLVGLTGHAHHIASEVLAGCIHDLRDSDRDLYDSLATVLCWQPFNLFVGLRNRPAHSPDPSDMMPIFKDVGASPFDFPIVAPPNGARANTLHRAFQEMTEYNVTGAMHPLGRSLGLLESVAGEDIIPAHDVNWFALRRDRFLDMSSMQRLEFYRACMRHGRAADAEYEYELLFGS
jgi:hypothetical protein